MAKASSPKRDLTDEDTERYVEQGGAACPFCGADEIEAGDRTWADGGASQRVDCLACGAAWHEIFEMTSVVVEHGPPSRCETCLDPDHDICGTTAGCPCCDDTAERVAERERL